MARFSSLYGYYPQNPLQSPSLAGGILIQKGGLRNSFIFVLIGIALSLGIAGCGSSSGGDPLPPQTASITVTQIYADGSRGNKPFIRLDEETLFSAEAIDFSGLPIVQPEYTWTVVGGDSNGTIDENGLYKPPSTIPTPNEVLIEVTEATNPDVIGSATVAIIAGATLQFSANKLIPVTQKNDVDTVYSVNTASSGQRSIAVVGDEVFIVWSDNLNHVTGNVGDYNVYLSVSSDMGETFGPAVRVNVASDVTLGRPCSDPNTPCQASIAVDLNGTAYVAWQDFRNANYDIYFTKCTKGINQQYFCEENIHPVHHPQNSGNQTQPSIVVNQAGEQVYVVWDDDASNEIFMASSGDGGLTFSDPVQVNDTDPSADKGLPSVAYLEQLEALYVVWVDSTQSNKDIYFSRSGRDPDGGITFDPSIKVNDDSDPGPRSQDFPTLAVDQSGTIYIAWQDFRDSDPVTPPTKPDIFLAKSVDGGKSFSPNIRINNDTGTAFQSKPTLAVDPLGEPFGNVLVAWRDERDGQNHIYFAKSLGGEDSFEQNVVVTDIPMSTGKELFPTLATDGAGRAYLMWTDWRTDYPRLYFSRGE